MKQINTLEDLNTAAKNRKSVVFGCGSFSRPIPAAVFLGMTGRTILGLIHSGVYIYEKPKKIKCGPSWFTRKAVNTVDKARYPVATKDWLGG